VGQRTSSTTGNDSIRQTACRRRPDDVTRCYSRRNADAFTVAKNKDCSGAPPNVQNDSRPIKSACSLRCSTNNNNNADIFLSTSFPFFGIYKQRYELDFILNIEVFQYKVYENVLTTGDLFLPILFRIFDTFNCK